MFNKGCPGGLKASKVTKMVVSLSKCKVAESSDNQGLKSGFDAFFPLKKDDFFSYYHSILDSFFYLMARALKGVRTQPKTAIAGSGGEVNGNKPLSRI